MTHTLSGVPECMHHAGHDMKHTKTRKYAWGRLSIVADMDRMEAPIRYFTDGDSEDIDRTPFQVADIRAVGNRWPGAFTLVNQWLKMQAG